MKWIEIINRCYVDINICFKIILDISTLISNLYIDSNFNAHITSEWVYLQVQHLLHLQALICREQGAAESCSTLPSDGAHVANG